MNGAERPRRALPKHILYGIVVAAAAVFLLQRFLRDDGALRAIPNDPQLATSWACQECGAVYSLTPRERIEWQWHASRVTLADGPSADGDRGDGETSIRGLVLGCRACGKMNVRKAFVCPQCRTPFAPMKAGRPQSCPTCARRPREAVEAAPRPRAQGFRGDQREHGKE